MIRLPLGFVSSALWLVQAGNGFRLPSNRWDTNPVHLSRSERPTPAPSLLLIKLFIYLLTAFEPADPFSGFTTLIIQHPKG